MIVVKLLLAVAGALIAKRLFKFAVMRSRRARLIAIRYTAPSPWPGSAPTGPIQAAPTIKTSPAITSVRYVKAGEWLKGL